MAFRRRGTQRPELAASILANVAIEFRKPVVRAYEVACSSRLRVYDLVNAPGNGLRPIGLSNETIIAR